DGVAPLVQAGAPHAERAPAGDDGDDAAADAALAGQPHAVGEVARRVVGAAGQHDGVDLLGLAAGEQPGAVGADAVPGEEGGGQRQVGAGGGDGALPEVLLEQDRHRVVDVAVGRHEVGQGGVPVAVRGLGGGDLLVEAELRV